MTDTSSVSGEFPPEPEDGLPPPPPEEDGPGDGAADAARLPSTSATGEAGSAAETAPKRRPDIAPNPIDPRTCYGYAVHHGVVEEPSRLAYVHTDRYLGAALPAGVDPATVPATHKQVAEAVAVALDGRVRYVPDGKSWSLWTGEGWEEVDATAIAYRIAGMIGRPGPARRFGAEAAPTRTIIPIQRVKATVVILKQMVAAGVAVERFDGVAVDHDGDPITHVYVPANEWAESADSIARIRTLLAGDPSVALAEFDADDTATNALGTHLTLDPSIADGSIEARPLSRFDTMRRSLNAVFDPEATCPTWEKAVAEITARPDGFGGFAYRPELAAFVQMMAGVTLLGRTAVEGVIMLHGRGANGKSEIVDNIQHLLGTYGVQLPSGLLLEKRGGGGGNSPTPDMALLRGARMGRANETDRARWDINVTKQLASKDRLVARELYRSNVEWDPSHQLWVTTNCAPLTAPGAHAFWRRMLIVPCDMRWWTEADSEADRAVSVAEADSTLKDRIRAEMPGILNWALAGLAAFYRDGLSVPQAVLDARAAAARDSNTWSQFLAETVTVTGNHEDVVTLTDLWELWKAYIEENSQHAKADPTTRGKVPDKVIEEMPTVRYCAAKNGHEVQRFTGMKLLPSATARKLRSVA